MASTERSDGVLPCRANFSLARCKSILPEQPPRLHLQPPCDSRDVVDRHVALRALDAAEVGSAHPAFVRQRLLAQPARGAQPAHVLGQDVPQRKVLPLSAPVVDCRGPLDGDGEYEPPLALALCLG
jgi:hypothetical protein